MKEINKAKQTSEEKHLENIEILEEKYLPSKISLKQGDADLYKKRYSYICRLLTESELIRLKNYLDSLNDGIRVAWLPPSESRDKYEYTGFHYLLQGKNKFKFKDGWKAYAQAIYNMTGKKVTFGIDGNLKNDGTIEPENIWFTDKTTAQNQKWHNQRLTDAGLTTTQYRLMKTGKSSLKEIREASPLF